MQSNHFTQDQKRMKPIVAASLGCFGAFLADGSEYTGNYGKNKDFLIDWHS
jgi:homocysteine S-methyltransferase